MIGSSVMSIRETDCTTLEGLPGGGGEWIRTARSLDDDDT